MACILLVIISLNNLFATLVSMHAAPLINHGSLVNVTSDTSSTSHQLAVAAAAAARSLRSHMSSAPLRLLPPVSVLCSLFSLVVFAAFDSGRSKRLLLADLERAARAFLRAQSVFSPSTPNDVRLLALLYEYSYNAFTWRSSAVTLYSPIIMDVTD